MALDQPERPTGERASRDYRRSVRVESDERSLHRQWRARGPPTEHRRWRFNDARSYVSLDHFARLRAHEARPGDLLVASLGDDLPRACLLPALSEPAIVKADCIRVRLCDDVEPRWVLYALMAPQTKRWAAEQLHGVGRQRLGLKVIRAIPIPVPPLHEQRRVVAILEDHLSRLDAASGLLLAAQLRLGRLHLAALDDVVIVGEPTPLGSLICRIEAGKSVRCDTRPAAGEEWGVIKVSAMTWGSFRAEENKALLSTDQAELRYRIRKGDLLLSRANTEEYVGASVLVEADPPRLLLSDKSLRIVPVDGVDRGWLWHVLSAPSTRKQISRRSTGMKASMRNVSQVSLATVPVPHPPSFERQIALVDRVDEIVSEARRLRDIVELHRARADVLRRSLLQAAFTGQLTASYRSKESANA